MRIYYREELNSYLGCPFHKGESFFTNGCGGRGNWINPLLSKLNSSKLFYGACTAHDILYSIVPEEYVTVIHKDNSFELKCRDDVDDFWLMLMLEACETRPWYSKWMYQHFAKRNYLFVCKFGDEYFVHSHR